MASEKNLKIALYSDDSSVRSSVMTALGRRVSAELPEHQIIEFATGPALRLYLDSKGAVDLFILDGEAVPEGSAYKLQAVTNGRLRVDPSVYPGRRQAIKKARK